MDRPDPAEGWPDRPLTEAEASDLLEGDANRVWVMDHDAATRAAFGADEDAVVDVVLETDDEYRMFSYAEGPDGTQWMDYGTEPAEGERGETMRETLQSYRVLAER